MPHFLAQYEELGKLPFTDEVYKVLYEAVSIRNPNESLICMDYEEDEFFIRKIKKPQAILFKAEKISKPSPIGILKGALRVLAKKSTLISHNLNNDSIKQTLKSNFFLKPQEVFRLDFSKLCIEIGFGSGRHLLKLAQENPHQTYIGMEIHTPSIQQVLRQIDLLGLKNLYIVCMDARVLLEILPSNSCEIIYVHFPVPWNKKPHRRVISHKFLAQVDRVLKKDGFLELRTDDEQYFRDSLEIAMKANNTRAEIGKNLSSEVISKYEARWQRAQKDIFDLRIFSLKQSEDKKIEYDFSFSSFSFNALEKIHQVGKIIKTDFFLHICEVFRTDDGKFILILSFGDFSWPVNKIVIFEKKRAYYFGGHPLSTEANINSHLELLNLLMEK
ncbi:tRNA (guanosine(46)-N7)-methyltransferase TrmB [Helicobacter cappadocius]|uniref:tRNA (guanine-N(7)-)-methyltransferase n=1 Tax=Helicobacter cappadocius TaxID=3063998 RepID=A0AA90PR08_9HELI|nr:MULTISPECIES: tRNA (guanosine(46)-N7)-methyltransferase TrmB [unclassified Helicobacter]MDO7253385.1 tRNA (guanosine(46)-N7)-methyltransferase TrmB [Helicobacter sp. faydin-H75]MDP2539351.1 tRNA (guanosine(46)-N7)-methyltransferase TrmB [Helicobacter sp. faydin-H76]